MADRFPRRRFLKKELPAIAGAAGAGLSLVSAGFFIGEEWQKNNINLPTIDQSKLVIDLFAPGDANDERRKAAYDAVGGAQYAVANQWLFDKTQTIASILNPVNSNLENRGGKPLEQLILNSHGSSGGQIYYNQYYQDEKGHLQQGRYQNFSIDELFSAYNAMSYQLKRTPENPLAKNIVLFGCEVLQENGQTLSDNEMRVRYGNYAKGLNTNIIAADTLNYEYGGDHPHVQAHLIKITPNGSIERKQINSVEDYREFLGEQQPSIAPTVPTADRTR
jgi:hypothetical protein